MTRPRSYPPHALGAWGESLATRRLRDAGWTILERGYRLGRREIDIVAAHGDVLAFIEVKTRAGDDFGAPEEAVTARKRREIEAVAADYLMRHRRPEPEVRLDVIAIVVGPGRRIERYDHIEGAWRPEP